jgi:glutamate N-acetyltransferase/amino-acid N-acetyltransferase
MKAVDGGAAAPLGFSAAAAAAGVKPGSARKDCALLFSDRPASAAGMFTINRVKAAPVYWCKDVCERGSARAVFINSGNANACTGAAGDQAVAETAGEIGKLLEISPEEVFVCSTGVIGVPLPMNRILDGARACLSALSRESWRDAAEAIMTTDTVPKARAMEVELSAGPVRIGGMAKGAGMLSPCLTPDGLPSATMLCFLTTDANVEQAVLHGLLRDAVDASFNCICVDNDASTNDTVLFLANGAAVAQALKPDSADYALFAEALTHLCAELAKDLVRDGEGATKFVRIDVEGARTDAEAQRAAQAIAHSDLCKTAFFGSDPNWGRIACAAGYSGAEFDPEALCIWLNDLCLMRNGAAADFEEALAASLMSEREFSVRVDLGAGEGRGRMWTSDLSYDYVKINADYRT